MTDCSARVSPPKSFAERVHLQARELPAWIRRGGCALKKFRDASLTARRRGGRVNSKENSLLNLVDRPVRSRQGGFAAFLLVAATPPDPGGEFARLQMDSLCKAPPNSLGGSPAA